MLHFTLFVVVVACDCIVGSSAFSSSSPRLLCLFLVRNSGYKPYLISLPSPPTLSLSLSLSVVLACLLCLAETVALDSVSDSDANVAVAAVAAQSLSDSNNSVGCCEGICFLMLGGGGFEELWGEIQLCVED